MLLFWFEERGKERGRRWLKPASRPAPSPRNGHTPFFSLQVDTRVPQLLKLSDERQPPSTRLARQLTDDSAPAGSELYEKFSYRNNNYRLKKPYNNFSFTREKCRDGSSVRQHNSEKFLFRNQNCQHEVSV